jgi:hypothetical protein
MIWEIIPPTLSHIPTDTETPYLLRRTYYRNISNDLL